METIRWKDPDFYRQIQRINYIQDLTAKTSSKCPECDTILTQEVSWEIYCPKCGLVVSSNINYVAGIQIDFPYGLRLWREWEKGGIKSNSEKKYDCVKIVRMLRMSL